MAFDSAHMRRFLRATSRMHVTIRSFRFPAGLNTSLACIHRIMARSKSRPFLTARAAFKLFWFPIRTPFTNHTRHTIQNVAPFMRASLGQTFTASRSFRGARLFAASTPNTTKIGSSLFIPSDHKFHFTGPSGCYTFGSVSLFPIPATANQALQRTTPCVTRHAPFTPHFHSQRKSRRSPQSLIFDR
jgi:hypothetical protein